LTTVLEAVNAAFQALFYGDGAWFGLLLILSICIGLMLKWKYSGVLFLPVTIFLGIDYLDHSLPWHALIVWSSSLFLMLYMVKQLK
jgi:hypothetical protein